MYIKKANYKFHPKYTTEEKEKFEIIDNVKYRVLYVTREFTPIVCRKCGCLVTKTKEYVKRKVKTFLTMIIQL